MIVDPADGSGLREKLTHDMPPKPFAFGVRDLGDPINATPADDARGEWCFSAGTGYGQVQRYEGMKAVSARLSVPLRWRYMDPEIVP
jgi:hypothetical protein